MMRRAAMAAVLAGLALGAGSGSSARAGSTGTGFELTRATVAPKLALFDAPRPVKLSWRFRAGGPRDTEVRVVRKDSGDTVAVFRRRDAEPRRLLRQRWNGLNRRGRPAPDGRYEFRAGRAGGRLYFAGRFVFHGYTYPVDGPHGPRAGIGEYGAPRSGGRTHEGYDILAACGTPLVAARGGRVTLSRFDERLYGWHLRIAARAGDLDFFYAHLAARPRFARGERVRTGQLLGHVGLTGNAASTPCHLHFEVRERRRHIDPEPLLRVWDRWS